MAYRLTFLILLTLAQASVALQQPPKNPAPRPAPSAASLAGESNFIFRGTVSKLQASTVDAVAARPNTDVVHVEEMLAGADTAGDFTGQDITVILRQPQSVKVGDNLVFFSNVVAYGKSIAVQEVGHVSGNSAASSRGQIAQAVQQRPERELQKRLARANLVVTGKVVSYKPVTEREGRSPSSEHEPQWFQAEIAVESTEKGTAPGSTVVAYVPVSDDIRWYRAPKLQVGQQGVFLLYQMEIPELKTRGLVPETSADVQPISERDRIRSLVKQTR